MLERLAASGNAELAERAGRTLRLTQSLAAFRAQLSTGAAPPAAARSTGLKRQVFDCKGTSDLPGDPVRQENGSASRDKAVNEAYDNAGTTWHFYNQIFGRQSVDDHGKILVSSVHRHGAMIGSLGSQPGDSGQGRVTRLRVRLIRPPPGMSFEVPG